MSNPERVRELFDKYIRNEHSIDELDEMLGYLKEPEHSRLLSELIEKDFEKPLNLSSMDVNEIDPILKDTKKSIDIQILSSNPEKGNLETWRYRNRTPYLKWVGFAASLLLLCGISLTLYLFQNAGEQTTSPTAISDVEFPAVGMRATLTMEDGTAIALREDQSGIRAGEKEIHYEDGSRVSHFADAKTLTISTPRAGHYNVTLSDGTEVWLNAASSISFPSQFARDHRVVHVSGEVYFNVAKNEAAPFTIQSKDQKITVLGTEFNVNTYENENAITTTLIEGSILLSNTKNKKLVVLKPGQQARLNAGKIEVVEVDTELYTAWKDGFILFSQADLNTVMRQIERWYDVDFDKSTVPLSGTETAYGKVSKNSPLSEILHALEVSYGIKFKLDGRRIMLIP